MGELAGMNVFPIRTSPLVRADFAQAWSGGHQGTDIFAPLGAEVLAVADGIVKHAVEPKGGKAVYLTTRDGTQYYYAHLDSFAEPRLGPGETRRVSAGDVIGTVGATGNAQGKQPHVHFEIRPQGGAKVDPYPFLVSAAAGPKPAQAPASAVRDGWPQAEQVKQAPVKMDGLGLAFVIGLVLWGRRRG